MTRNTTLSFTRTLAATPAAVWRCWTEPHLVKQWFAPRPVVTTEVEIDPRPGGIFRTVMQVPDHGEMSGAAGCILLAEPHRRLVWTTALGPEFHPNDIDADVGGFAFTADFRISPADTGCTYVVTVMHATPEASAAHAGMGFHDGWGTAATQMETVAQDL